MTGRGGAGARLVAWLRGPSAGPAPSGGGQPRQQTGNPWQGASDAGRVPTWPASTPTRPEPPRPSRYDPAPSPGASPGARGGVPAGRWADRRCRACGQRTHPRTHLIDPATLGLPAQRWDDGRPAGPPTALPVWLRRRGQEEHRGQALVEAALVLPIWLLVIVAGLELGLGEIRALQLQAAAQELADSAAADPDPTCDETLVDAAALGIDATACDGSDGLRLTLTPAAVTVTLTTRLPVPPPVPWDGLVSGKGGALREEASPSPAASP